MGRFTFKNRGKRKEFFLAKEEELKKSMVFEGHDLPFTIDSETGNFWGNAKFNFVTDKPEELKAYIKKNCLNPSSTNFEKVVYTGSD